MAIRLKVIALITLSLLSAGALAEPACTFENTGHRRISPDNPKDWQCMQLLAAQGNAFQQFYVGHVYISGWGEIAKDVPKGLALLTAAAKSDNSTASKNAMNALARFYQSDSTFKNHELAYQWLYLVYPTTANEEFNGIIPAQRMRELQQSAPSLLQNR